MKYIEKELLKEILDKFFEKFKLSKSQYTENKFVLNSSVRRKFFEIFPKYEQICQSILNKQSKFQKLNFVLRCILLDIDLRICKKCNKEIRYTSKSIFCSKKCLLNDEDFKKYKSNKVHQFYEKKKLLNPKPIDTRTKEQKHIDAVNKSKLTLAEHRKDPIWVQNYNLHKSKTNMEHFGNEKGWIANPNCAQRKSFSNKRLDRLWKTILSWKDYIIPLFDRNELENLRSGKTYKWQCAKCCNTFESILYTTAHIQLPKFRYCPRCLLCYPKLGVISKEEIELANEIKHLFGKFVEVYLQCKINKALISPYEIDIVLKNRCTNELIGIEYNGVFIHSIENGYKIGYHLKKTIKAENKNIKLIHIFSSDWLYDKTNVMSLIGLHIFGKYDFNMNSPAIRLDRSKYNLCVKLLDFKLAYIEQPKIIKLRKTNTEYYLVENCGYLVYTKSK